MSKKVGIVMPCINLWDKYTFPALQSVATAQRIAAEQSIVTDVLLIDNSSTDNTKEQASTRSGITYHRNEEMWGFQRSVNFGVKHFFDKGFDYVLILNNDIVLHPQAIVRLVGRFAISDIPIEGADNAIPMESDNLGMATCLDVTGESNRDPQQMVLIKDTDKDVCPETPHPCFSAFMVNRKCWDTVGEFDEIFFPAYYEDNDYHYRMQLAGILAITYPPAMFFHWGSATQNEALGRPLTESSNQHAQYVRKWGGDPGHEKWKTPYNYHEESIKRTTQSPTI